MYDTLLEKVKANIDEKILENDGVVLRGWAFSEENGVCPIRCKYESTIRSVDIEIRKDVVELFARPNIILSGWKINVPLDKYIDLQIKLGQEWCTFLSYNSVAQLPTIIESKEDVLQPELTKQLLLPIQTYNDHKTSADHPVNQTNVQISFDSQSSSLSNVYIIDNFYSNPEQVRLFGVSSVKQSDQLMTTQSFKNNTSLKEKIQKIIGKQLVSFSQYDENGQFFLSDRLAAISFTEKPYQYAGVVFLTPNAPVTSGVTLYRSKTNSTELEAVDNIGNVFNRLVLFNAKQIHSVTHHFGSNIEESRLVQHFAFDLL